MKKKNHWEIIFGVTFVPIVYFTFVLFYFVYSKIVGHWSNISVFLKQIEDSVMFVVFFLAEKITEINALLYNIIYQLLS